MLVFFMTPMKVICMKKIAISIATTLIATAVLVACNGATGSDITSDNATPVSKAVCTSLNNWLSVGVGMSTAEVEARLGAPGTIATTDTITTFTYERCRSGSFLVTAAVEASGTTPAKPAVYQTFYFSGQVVLSSSRGVTSVITPVLKSDLPMACEWDMYNYPFNYGEPGRVCRTASNPY